MKSVVEILNSDIICSHDYRQFNFNLDCNKVISTKYLSPLNRQENNILEILKNIIFNTFGLNWLVIKTVLKFKKKIVLVNNFPLSLILLPTILLRFAGVKFYWFDYNIRTYDKILGLLTAWVCQFIYNKTFVVSEAVSKKYFLSWKINLVYNGIDCNRFTNNDSVRVLYRTKFQFKNDDLVIGILGTISFEKGIDYVIKAFKSLSPLFSHLSLLIVGKYINSSQREIIEKEIFEIKNHRIIRLDWINNIEEIYSAIDILVNATSTKISEPLGMTILEAMSCEKIVVASNTGGTREIIIDGVSGFLFNPDDTHDLIEKLDYVIKHYNELKPIRLKARETIINKFSLIESISIIKKNILFDI